MGLSETLSGFYRGLEDRFFAVADFLDSKGVPVYTVIDALEQRGIPAFPVITAGFLLLLGLVVGLVLVGTTYDVQLTLHFVDQFEQPVSDVEVVVKGEAGNKYSLPKEVFRDGETVEVKGVPIGATLIVIGSREGYLSGNGEVKVSEKAVSVAVLLQKDVKTILGKALLVDAETRDRLKNAKVVARLKTGEEIPCEVSDNGEVTCLGVPEGEDVELKVYADNYEEKEFTLRFSEGSTSELAVPPKASATMGLSNVIFRVFDTDTKALVPNISVKVYDLKDGQLIVDDVDEDGEYFTKIAKGTSIRYVVSAQGYITFDSSVELVEKTLRDDSEVVQVNLRKGGASIHVTVVAQDSSLVLSNATVELYNDIGEVVDSGLTQFGGDVFFRNIDAEQKYYVTASADKYLPSRLEVHAQQQTEYTIQLTRAAPDNSTTLSIFVTDSAGDAAPDAVLTFYEVADPLRLPLGVPQAHTDITGYAKATVPVGKPLVVTASKGNEKGEAGLTPDAKAENRLEIFLAPDKDVFTLRLVDARGSPVTGGTIVVQAGSGATLYSGPVTNGVVYFNPAGLKTAKISYTGRDGDLFEEEIFLEGKDELTITIGEQKVTGLAPSVEFQGLEDPNGNKAEGLVKGQDYYAVFKTAWPDGTYKGGMHFRFGPDEVRFADSADVGIIGFNGSAPRFAYGRSYTPSPSPGYEGIDLRNRGIPGEYNRWLELYNEGGAGERVYKVRLRAKETAAAGTYPLFYRAWARIGASYYRLPRDPILEALEFNGQRTALYAETERVDVKVFDAKPSCKDEFCATYRFLAEDGSQYDPAQFRAVVGGLYALEIEVAPSQELTATVKGSTAKAAPKIFFTGFGVEQFADFPDKNATDTDVEIKDVKISPEKPMKIRLYFKAAERGSSTLTTQLVTAQNAVTQTFNFEVSQDQALVVTVDPDRIVVGQDFSLSVKGEDGTPVEKATIQFLGSDNLPRRTINGTGTVNRGLNGLYQVKNSFPAGSTKFVVKAEGYKPFEGFVEIGREGVLVAPQQVEINIPKAQKSADVKFDLKNASPDRVQDLTVEVTKIGEFPEGLDLRVTPPNAIEPNTAGKVTVTGEYAGSGERAHGEADVVFRGRIFGKFSVEGQTHVVIDYNRPLDPNCVEFSAARLVTFLLTEAASTETVQVTAKNKCPVQIEMESTVVPVGLPDQSVRIVVGNLVLGPAGTQNDTKTFNVAVVNELARNYEANQTLKYNVMFRSDLLTKSLPLEVVLWNKNFALQVTRNLDIYLADTGQGEAKVTVPIYATNVGYADIQNLTFSVGGARQSGNAKVEIEPKFPVAVLRRGQSLVPPYFVVARAERTAKTTPLDVQEIGIRGIINGKTYDFGPIVVTVHISPKQCVIVAPNYVEFRSARSKEGALQQELTVKNNCAEEVRIRDIEPKGIGANALDISGRETLIPPGASAKVNLVLTKNEDYHTVSPVPAFLRLLLVRSGKFVTSENFNLQVDLGKVAATRGVAATDAVRVPVCGNEKSFKLVSFPKIAKQGDCDKAYCDAEQLAGFLARKIQEKLRDAQRQITTHYKNEVANTNCQADAQALNQSYCLFDYLGLKPDSFDVYFTNDALDAEMLRDAFAKKAPELSAYNIQMGAFSEDQFKAGQGTGYGKQIYFTDSFQGCGLYKARITGAVQVQAGRMIPDFMNVLVDLKAGLEEDAPVRELTQQCENKIQNAMAFLPLDLSYEPDNARNSLMGLVSTSDDKLYPLAEDFAQTLFNSKKRAVPNSAGNHLELSMGDTQGYILKLSMLKAGEPGEAKTIDAMVHRFEQGDEQTKTKVQKEIMSSSAKAIREMADRVIDGCITDDESEFRIKSTQKLGQIEIDACPNPLTVSMRTACCDFNVSSDVPEPVRLSVNQESDFQGLKEFYVQTEAESKVLKKFMGRPYTLKETAAASLGERAEVELKKVDKKGRYYKDFQVCALGDNYVQMAHGKKLVLGTQSAVYAQKRADDKAVSLQVCGIHPYDLMERISKEPIGDGETKVFYATVAWKGDPDKITLNDLRKYEDAQTRLEDATKILANTPPEGQTSYDSKFRNQKLLGIGAYTVGCVLGSFLSKPIPIIGQIAAAISIPFDCGIPMVAALGEEYGVWGKIGESLGRAWTGLKNVLGFGGEAKPEDIADRYASMVDQAAAGKKTGTQELQAMRHTEDLLLRTGMVTTGIDGIREAWRAAFKKAPTPVPGAPPTGAPPTPGAPPVPPAATAGTVKVKGGIWPFNNVDSLVDKATTDASDVIASKIGRGGILPEVEKERLKTLLKPSLLRGINSAAGQELTASAWSDLITQSIGDMKPDELAKFLKDAETRSLLSPAGKAVLGEAQRLASGGRLAAIAEGALGKTPSPIAVDILDPVKRPGAFDAMVSDTSDELFKSWKQSAHYREVMEGIHAGDIARAETEFAVELENSVRRAFEAELNKLPTTAVRGVPVATMAGDKVLETAQRALDSTMQRGLPGATPGSKLELISKRLSSKLRQVGTTGELLKDTKTLDAIKAEVEAYAKASPAAKKSGFKSFIKGFFTSPFKLLGGLLKGLAGGALAQLFGQIGWHLYWGNFAPPIAPTEAINAVETAKTSDGKAVQAQLPDLEVQKYETYKVTLSRHGDKKDISVEHVTDLAGVDPTKKIEDCTGKAFEKDVQKLLHNLRPDAGAWGEKGKKEARFVKAYYETVGAYSTAAARQHEVPEALLITIGIWETELGLTSKFEYVTACGKPDPKFRDLAESFDCAAKELKAMGEACGAGEEKAHFVCTVQAYGKKFPAKEKPDFEVLYDTYARWNASRLS